MVVFEQRIAGLAVVVVAEAMSIEEIVEGSVVHAKPCDLLVKSVDAEKKARVVAEVGEDPSESWAVPFFTRPKSQRPLP